MEQDIKKLILGDCEVTDTGCHIIADIVKVNDTTVELDLLKNTKSGSSKILSLPQQVANAQDVKIVSRRDPAVNQ